MTTPFQTPEDGDGVDRMLRDYYRTKLPRAFPPLPLVEPARQPRRAAISRSRQILAVCALAVLIGFGYLLAAGPRIGPRAAGLSGDSSATNIKPHETLKRK